MRLLSGHRGNYISFWKIDKARDSIMQCLGEREENSRYLCMRHRLLGKYLISRDYFGREVINDRLSIILMMSSPLLFALGRLSRSEDKPLHGTRALETVLDIPDSYFGGFLRRVPPRRISVQPKSLATIRSFQLDENERFLLSSPPPSSRTSAKSTLRASATLVFATSSRNVLNRRCIIPLGYAKKTR